MQTDSESLTEISRLLDMYINEIQSSELKPLAANIYLTHAKNFVRWIEGEFVPGGRLEKNKVR
ncbi:hypothetical protein ACFP1I_06730 [Dyadobacter subterraneus]|jgi:hypothetical protein|uniref:Core-binding (CB) domain-containing protein n=1 Tax=Dyadobacter subterraneus TaxID=2773304 RepID=A0ABR9WGY0_9BACT|nr:hypothetical protein [Dyadobacter subterraneus]MBE9464176.1 hypothetical protein [Dyadobacter subterraneus]